MTDFKEFWEIARSMRGRCQNPRIAALVEWDKAIARGEDPREIIAGTIGYNYFNSVSDQDLMYVPQTRKYLKDGGWEQYLSEPPAKAYLAAPKLVVVK